MKKFLSTFLKRATIGAAFGVLINQLIFLFILNNVGQATVDFSFMFKQFWVSCVVGGFSVGMSIIYDYEELNMLFKTLIHFILGLGVYLGLGCYVGWFTLSISTVVISVVIYFSVWSLFYLYNKRKIKEINDMLIRKKEK